MHVDCHRERYLNLTRALCFAELRNNERLLLVREPLTRHLLIRIAEKSQSAKVKRVFLGKEQKRYSS